MKSAIIVTAVFLGLAAGGTLIAMAVVSLRRCATLAGHLTRIKQSQDSLSEALADLQEQCKQAQLLSQEFAVRDGVAEEVMIHFLASLSFQSGVLDRLLSKNPSDDHLLDVRRQFNAMSNRCNSLLQELCLTSNDACRRSSATRMLGQVYGYGKTKAILERMLDTAPNNGKIEELRSYLERIRPYTLEKDINESPDWRD